MLDEQKKAEFAKRVDRLALALALKPNDKGFGQADDFKLLISTYIKMIDQDSDNFLSKMAPNKKIIRSLERTKEYFDYTKVKELQTSL